MRANLNFFLPLLIFMITTSLFAERGDVVPGYIIYETGRKVTGEIVVGSITDNEVKIKFIHRSGKKETFKPTDIVAYGFEDIIKDDVGFEDKIWKHYLRKKADYPAKPFGSTLVFMHREVKGPVSIYCYYVEVRTDVTNPFRYYYYMETENGEFQKIERDDFALAAKKTFKSYTALYNRIGLDQFQYRDFDRMVRDYNYWIDNQHERTEYRVALLED